MNFSVWPSGQVSVSKNGSALLFECESDGDVLNINHIAFEPSKNSDVEEEEVDGTPDYTGRWTDALSKYLI